MSDLERTRPGVRRSKVLNIGARLFEYFLLLTTMNFFATCLLARMMIGHLFCQRAPWTCVEFHRATMGYVEPMVALEDLLIALFLSKALMIDTTPMCGSLPNALRFISLFSPLFSRPRRMRAQT